MKTLWEKFTLADFATEEDDGEIPPMAPIWCALIAAIIWAAWIAAVWIVEN